MGKKKSSNKNMKDKRLRFATEYVHNTQCNSAEAARRAGYSEKTARTMGSFLLTQPDVQDKIRELQEQMIRANIVTAQRVIDEFATIAFSDIGQILTFGDDGVTLRHPSEVSESARRAISSVKIRRDVGSEDRAPAEIVEFKLWDKNTALTKLATHLGLLVEKSEVTKRVKVELVEEIVESDPEGEHGGGSQEEDPIAPDAE